MPEQNELSSYEDTDRLPPAASIDVPQDERDRQIRYHDTTFESCWRVLFHVMDYAPMLPRPMDVNVQIVRDARYRHPCLYSQDADHRYFCYTLSGIGGFWDASGTYSVPPGHAFLLEKDNAEAGYFYPEGANEPWRFLGFTFKGLSATAMARAMILRYGSIYALPPETPILQRLLGYEGVGERVTNIPLAESTQLVVDLLQALLLAAQKREDAAPGNELIQRAVAILISDEDVSVQDIAARLGVSREHLSRSFQKRFGMSPRQFSLKQRMHKACILLKSSKLSINAVALHLGYAEYANFAHAFQRTMLMSPGEFRRRGVLPLSFMHGIGTASLIDD